MNGNYYKDANQKLLTSSFSPILQGEFYILIQMKRQTACIFNMRMTSDRRSQFHVCRTLKFACLLQSETNAGFLKGALFSKDLESG